MDIAITATLIYAFLSCFGGIWGYIKSNSKPSLIAGCVSGILLLLAAWMQVLEIEIGLLISQIVILLLVIVFAIRLIKTRKFMPSGIMLMVGVAALVAVL